MKAKTPTPTGDLVKRSISLVRDNFVEFTYLVLLPGLLSVLGSLLLHGIFDANGHLQLAEKQTVGLVLVGVAYLWIIINLGPVTYFKLQVSRGKQVSVRDCYRSGLSKTLPLIGMYLVSAAIIFIGLLLLIIPGIIAIRCLTLAPYYMLDQKLSIMGAIKLSTQQSKDFRGVIWSTLIVQFLINLAGGLLGIIPFIGILLSTIVIYTTLFLMALRYYDVKSLVKR